MKRQIATTSRTIVHTSTMLVVVGATALLTAPARADFSNGFEVNTFDWTSTTRVPSGTNGIPSATGGFHGEVVGTGFTHWGGYSLNPGCFASGPCSVGPFPTNGYTTSVDIYLNVAGGWANNTRFDFSSAISQQNGTHLRDFIFNAGFYNDTDGSPGSGTNRFIVSASNNSQPGSAFAKNPGMGPIAISTSGWYTFSHRFYDNGGVLACEMTIRNSVGALVNSWTRSNPADLIATVVGGNRYGWFDFNQFPFLAIDNSLLRTPVVKNLNTGETFFAIQDAINDSDTLDTHVLKMLVNNHSEGPQIVFSKSLTLQGTGVEVIRALGNTGLSGDGRGWILVNAGEVCHFTGLEFNGNGQSIADGIRINGSGSVSQCRFREIRYQVSGGPYDGRAINSRGDGPVNVTYCDLATCGRIGMYWAFPTTNGSLCEGNVYTGKGLGDCLDYGIEVEAGASITARGNTIINCTGVASDSSTSGAVLATTFFAAGTNINAYNNTIRDNTVGIALGFASTDTTTCTANYNSFVNNDFAVDHTNVAALVNAENNWWNHATGPEDTLGTNEASPTTCFPPATMVNADGAGDVVGDINIDYCPWLTAPASLSINPITTCYTGTSVVVKIRMSQVKNFVVGGQFFLAYDNTRLDFVSATVGSFPFTQEIFELVNEGAGTIDYAVGVLAPHPGTPVDTDMVVLTFDRIGQTCPTANLVTFRAHSPPTRLTNMFGDPLNALLNNLPSITIDSTQPIITCPGNISVNAAAGTCSANVVVGTASATDNCTALPTIGGVRSDALALNAPYPSGVTTITWTATDACGNSSTCQQTVTVSSLNEIVANIELPGVWANVGVLNISRCISFEVHDCGGGMVPINQVVNFVSSGPGVPAVGSATLLVPCAGGTLYDCITARDRRHTLRRTADSADANFGIVGPQYVAQFTGAASNDLNGGNLNDDLYVDILDFGMFVGQYGVNYGTGNTTCATLPPHADINGDGLVTAVDYSFIQINFLDASEANCCSLPSRIASGNGGAGGSRPPQGPITRISVKELIRRGMNDVIAGDINHDGWVDEIDIQAFMNGG